MVINTKQTFEVSHIQLFENGSYPSRTRSGQIGKHAAYYFACAQATLLHKWNITTLSHPSLGQNAHLLSSRSSPSLNVGVPNSGIERFPYSLFLNHLAPSSCFSQTKRHKSRLKRLLVGASHIKFPMHSHRPSRGIIFSIMLGRVLGFDGLRRISWQTQCSASRLLPFSSEYSDAID